MISFNYSFFNSACFSIKVFKKAEKLHTTFSFAKINTLSFHSPRQGEKLTKMIIAPENNLVCSSTRKR